MGCMGFRPSPLAEKPERVTMNVDAMVANLLVELLQCDADAGARRGGCVNGDW